MAKSKNITLQYASVRNELKDYKEYLLSELCIARESKDFKRAQQLKTMVLKLESKMMELSKGSSDYISVVMDTNITSNVIYQNQVYIDLGVKFDSSSKAKVNKFIANIGLTPIW